MTKVRHGSLLGQTGQRHRLEKWYKETLVTDKSKCECVMIAVVGLDLAVGPIF